MCSDENVIPPPTTIPKLHLRRDMIHGCLHELGRVSEPRKAGLRAEFARDIHRHEEEISFVGIQCSDGTRQKNLVNGNFGGKQMVGTAFVDQPVFVKFRRQVIDVDSNCVREVQRVEGSGIKT